jgi:hypothetical protein
MNPECEAARQAAGLTERRDRGSLADDEETAASAGSRNTGLLDDAMDGAWCTVSVNACLAAGATPLVAVIVSR